MKKWITFAVLFFLYAIMQYVRGYYRIEAYVYDETFPQNNMFAYVGNDADNYIINSNVLIGHYVLCGASLICGMICIATGSIIKAIKNNKEVKEIKQVA